MKRAGASPGVVVYGRKLRALAVDSVRALPLTLQFSVTRMDRLTYSCTCRHALLGSANESPPSPPKWEPMTESPGRRIEAPLSCRPPVTMTPLGAAGSLPIETE